MDRHTNRPNSATDLGLTVCTDWCRGPRTPAWDRFWQAILRELDPEPAAGDGHEPEREGDDA